MIKMNEYDEIAAGIIDLILDSVLEQNPEIDVEQKEGNTLIYGEPYYRLEIEIADKIMEKYPKVCHVCHKVMCRDGVTFYCENKKCVEYDKDYSKR